MNFKLNTLVAAALLVAAGSANAAINNGQATGSLAGTANAGVNGMGELFLVVSDTTAGYSFVGDLGVGFDSFLGTSNVSNSWTLGNFSAWTSFVSAIGGDLTNAKYSVYAFDNMAPVAGADTKRLLTTIAAGDDVNGYTTTNTKLGNAIGTSNATTWLVLGAQDDIDNLLNDHDTVADGSSYTSSVKTGYADAAIGDDLSTGTQFFTTVAAADLADFWMLGNTTGSAGAQANTYMQAGQFSLTGTTLSYTVAAVPEADTYAMMLAGLGLVGFMVRRRKA